MATSGDDTGVNVDAFEARRLASTILIAGELLDHEELDEVQRDRIQQTLTRAATALAHEIMVAADADLRGDADPRPQG